MKKIAMGFAIIFLIVSLGGAAVAKKQKKVALGAPTALKLMIVPNGFKLTWKPSPQDPAPVNGYELVRASVASGPFIRVATMGKGVCEYIDNSAKPENIYYYKIRAVSGAEKSPYSNTVTGER